MSLATAKPEYALLLARILPAVIRSEKDNDRYIRMLEELDFKPNPSAAERRLADLLTLLIEEFEERHYALKAASAAEVLAQLMQANGLKQKDLLEIFVTPSIVSEILRGKRRLTTEHIRKLSLRFHVSPAVFFPLEK
jgi:HTH-type transcriptional regulator/antitoxin HigA